MVYPIFNASGPNILRTKFFRKKEKGKTFHNLLRDRDNDSICTFSRHFEFRAIDT